MSPGATLEKVNADDAGVVDRLTVPATIFGVAWVVLLKKAPVATVVRPVTVTPRTPRPRARRMASAFAIPVMRMAELRATGRSPRSAWAEPRRLADPCGPPCLTDKLTDSFINR